MNPVLTPEQRFRRWVYVSLSVGILAFVYFVVADLHMPVSPEARVRQVIVQVAPEVSGRVSEVLVVDNQHVETGAPLFVIDGIDYAFAVDQADLGLEQATRANLELDASIDAAKAQVVAARLEASHADQEARRYAELLKSSFVSRQSAEDKASTGRVLQARATSAERDLNRLIVERGQRSGDNLQRRVAGKQLEIARRTLSKTTVRAGVAGTVSNVQLRPGAMVGAGAASLALITDEKRVYADFREKALRDVHPGTKATVVFDAIPGEVFDAEVTSIDAGVRSGQLSADGTLATTEQTDRWVREAERARVNLRLIAPPKDRLMAGARATVQLYPAQSRIAALLGDIQIRLISWFHYVY